MDLFSNTPIQWVVLAAFIAAVLHGIITFIRHRRFYKNLPKPPHSFFWGHLKLVGETLRLFPNNVHIQLAITTLSQKYKLPRLFYIDLWPFGPDFLVITDPNLALQISNFRNLYKHHIAREVVNGVVGKDNIVTTDGPLWKKLHNMVAPSFSDSQVKNMVGMIAEEVMTFRQILLDRARDGQPFNLEETINRLSFDIIGKTTFGFPFESQRNGSPILTDFHEVTNSWLNERKTWNPLKRLLSRQKKIAATKRMDSYLEKEIRKRFETLCRDQADLTQKRGLTIVDLLLRESLEQNSQKGWPGTLDAETLRLIVVNIKAFLLAGSGTTADTLSFTYMLLTTHPEVVEKLRAEHDRVFSPSIETTYAMLQGSPYKINDLEYTTNVIKETLRYFPIGFSARSYDDFITYNGIQYPAKDHMVCMAQHTMQMNPELFPNPGKFDPDRFSRNESPPHAWRPFEKGPRSCVGKTLAMDEMRVILLLTSRDFDFDCHGLKPYKEPAVDWWDMDTMFGERAYPELIFEAKPRGGMMMTVKRSQHGAN
ncbi:cytochrome P450 3A30 [Delitschia confertaspora ATCC 74209]|uniref:Cytochrome P450 3A30 n=1 Tax=Delitschia confertaspora ATCC 74209 TaxID=1513339 RepID=A0A9P4MXJ8_9PLEO|nr:cytochrome P450 3A30 [Delitschia confertaspora ATCC 74209]